MANCVECDSPTVLEQECYEQEILLEPEAVYITSGGGCCDYNELSNKPSINGVELIGNKSLDDLGVRNYVVQILIDYGLIGGGHLTPEQIAALNEMSCEITSEGNLVITYDENALDIAFSRDGVNLIMDNNINAVFNINNNNLEATYDND